MTLRGYCKEQNREYVISVDEIYSPTLQKQNRILYGLIDCDYASRNDCTGECSILAQHGIKQN